MEPIHYELWRRCAAFVGEVCADRDASHGLGHMRKVSEQAVLLYLMDLPIHANRAERAGMLYRILLVAMLHDVADHKYDVDGNLFQRVEEFVEAEAATLVSLTAPETEGGALCIPLSRRRDAADFSEGAAIEEVKRLLLTSLDAISYSKENKRGMRWFVPALNCSGTDANDPAGVPTTCDWVAVRDYVSDADKLEAIGEEGLLRCYEYTCATYRAAAAAASKTRSTAAIVAESMDGSQVEQHVEALLLKNVVEHFHEKLKRLLPEFIVTHSGKFLGAPRQADMAALLVEWEAHGPPPVTMYWGDVASTFVMKA